MGALGSTSRSCSGWVERSSVTMGIRTGISLTLACPHRGAWKQRSPPQGASLYPPVGAQVLEQSWPLEENERAAWLFTGVECATRASLPRGEGDTANIDTANTATQLNKPNNHIWPAYHLLYTAWTTGLKTYYYLSIYWMYTCASVWIWSILDSVTCPCSLLPLTDKLLSPGKR